METRINSFALIVNEASIKNNNLPVGEFKLNPQIKRRISKSINNDNNYNIEVRCEIISTTDEPFPIDLTASVSGIFSFEGDNVEEINNFLQVQGFQMVFPYLRTLVSNITSSAMMPAIMLPIVFANDFVDENIAN